VHQFPFSNPEELLQTGLGANAVQQLNESPNKKERMSEINQRIMSFATGSFKEVQVKDIIIKIKRRWCMLDGDSFTFYRSYSRRRAKGTIHLDPENVSLVTSPFYLRSGSATSEEDGIAIVIKDTKIMVIRAETFQDQIEWERAFRARLLSNKTYSAMQSIYSL